MINKGGYSLVDGTGLDLADVTVTKLPQLFKDLKQAVEADKLILLTNVADSSYGHLYAPMAIIASKALADINFIINAVIYVIEPDGTVALLGE